jgi:hypothetical protein
MRRHPVLEALLKLREKPGTLFLERDGHLLALFHLEEGRLLKATGLVTLDPEIPPVNLHRLLPLELRFLRQVEERRGWHEAWRLTAEQLTLSLFALRGLPGKKRLGFAPAPTPEAVRRYGAGYRSVTHHHLFRPSTRR